MFRNNKLYKFLVKQISVDRKSRIKDLSLLKEVDFAIFKNIVLGRENNLDFTHLVKKATSLPIDYPSEYQLFVKEGRIIPKPLTVNVETTTRCNLRCKMCPRNRLTNEIGDMNAQVLKRSIEEIAKIQSAIKFNRLGEPLLDKNIVENIRYAKEKGIHHIYLNTNGVLLNEKIAQELIKAGLDRIIISFDGATKKTFEAIRRGANYEKVVENLKGLLRQKKKLGAKNFIVVLRITVLDENKSEVLDIYRQWFGLVTDIVSMVAFSYQGIIENQIVQAGLNERVPCSAVLGRSVICQDGTVIICCPGDPDAELKCGNILTNSLLECYSGPQAAEIRNIHRNKDFQRLPVCEQCSFTYKNIWYADMLSHLIDRESRKIVMMERLLGKSQKIDISK